MKEGFLNTSQDGIVVNSMGGVSPRLVFCDWRKSFDRLVGGYISPTLLGTDYKSPHITIVVYEK